MKNTVKHTLLIVSAMIVLLASCKKPDYSIAITTDMAEPSVVITAGTPIILKYTINSPTGVLTVDVKVSDNITLTHLPSADKMTGQAILVLNSKADNSFCTITADNGQNKADYKLDLEMETVQIDGDSKIAVSAQGGNFQLKIKSNIDYVVNLPKNVEWLSVVETKAISSHDIVLHADANDDVKRSATVSVASSVSPELNVSFEIVQDGILNNLLITYKKDLILAPNLLGSSPTGTIYWGDGFKLEWQPDAQHRYSDSATTHHAEIHTAADGFEFTTMQGVAQIDLTDFIK